jgi:hypothetical protein
MLPLRSQWLEVRRVSPTGPVPCRDLPRPWIRVVVAAAAVAQISVFPTLQARFETRFEARSEARLQVCTGSIHQLGSAEGERFWQYIKCGPPTSTTGRCEFSIPGTEGGLPLPNPIYPTISISLTKCCIKIFVGTPLARYSNALAAVLFWLLHTFYPLSYRPQSSTRSCSFLSLPSTPNASSARGLF